MSEVTPASTRLTWTEPVRGRATSAASAPTAHSSPAMRSSSATPAFVGGPSGVAGDRHQAADGLRQQVVGGPIGIGSGEAADARDDQGRVAGTERIGLEAQACRRGRPVVVHEQVGRREQALEAGAAGIGPQVEHDAALVAVHRCEVGAAPIRRVAPPRRTPAAGLVAVGRLDLDDVGAEIGEQHGRERARPARGWRR